MTIKENLKEKDKKKKDENKSNDKVEEQKKIKTITNKIVMKKSKPKSTQKL